MRIECAIVDGKVTVPEEWLATFKKRTGSEADTVVFDFGEPAPSLSLPWVGAGSWLLKKQGGQTENENITKR